MKKSTLLRVAITLTAMLFVSGVFAQTNITVKMYDGTTPASGTLTLNSISAVGVETPYAAFTNVVAGVVVATPALSASTLYSIVHSGGQRTTFKTPAVVVDFMISLDLAALATDYRQATSTTYQTKNKTFRLYVAPDPLFSPGYLFDGTNTGLNAASSWTWTYPAALVGSTPVTGVATLQQNWLNVVAVGAVGNYPVSVVETGPLGCVTGTGVTQSIQIINTPDATINGSMVNTWTSTADAVSLTKKACVSAITVPETVTVTISEDATLPLEFKSYALAISEVIDNVAIDLLTADGGPISTTDWDYKITPNTAKLRTGNAAIPVTHTWTPSNAVNSTYVLPTAALTVRNAKPTRYTYSITNASDAAGTGIVSAISQKSDYLTNGGPAGPFTTYGLAGVTTIMYIVLPAPTTGPIYHIPNTFAY